MSHSNAGIVRRVPPPGRTSEVGLKPEFSSEGPGSFRQTGPMQDGGRDIPLQTELRRDRERVEFVVHTTEALYQDRLLKMGWQPL
ncbi:MAG: hypothetical protein ACREP9_04905 [Candidatus Dormibacteraceae bacterium]